MHALASQGRLKDISRDLVHEYQRTACSSLAMPELSVAGSAAGVGDRTLSSAVDSYVDYVAGRRSTTENTSWLKDHHPAETSKTSAVLPPAPLQRLEELESELASLNHARRRLAVDDDAEAANASSNAAICSTVTAAVTDFDRGQCDVNHPVDRGRNDHAVAGGDLNISPWISSSFRDVVALHRHHLCGGSVLTASTAVITSCLQSSPLTSSSHRAPADAVSSLARLTDSRIHGVVADNGGDGSPSKWCCSAVIDARGSADKNEAACSVFPQTPAKRELASPPPDSAADSPSTSINGMQSHYVLGMY